MSLFGCRVFVSTRTLEALPARACLGLGASDRSAGRRPSPWQERRLAISDRRPQSLLRSRSTVNRLERPMSEKQYREKIASIKKQQANEEQNLGKARAAANKYRSDAHKELGKIKPNTSASMSASYRRAAESADKRAQAEDAKVTGATHKLSRLAADLVSAEASLDREVKSTERRDESARKAAARQSDLDDARRRATEKRHAVEIARLARPTVRYVHEVRTIASPKPEALRVLYLTANPDLNLRTEAQVHHVHEAVRRATHRDLIEIAHRPAATPEDLLRGLNDLRPHVVHFSGHAGGTAIVFDNASIDDPQGRTVTFDLLARTLAATDNRPTLLVLNGCDTLTGAEVLLESVPVIIAMATEISDLAASVFAAQFYSAIASAQTVGAAVEQGVVAVDLAGLEEGRKPSLLARDDVHLSELVLVRTPRTGQEEVCGSTSSTLVS